MTAFVAVGVLQFRAGQAQMFERRLHARLIGAGASGYESRGMAVMTSRAMTRR